MTDSLRISTLDAAHRQLNLAIRLLFASADPVAVQTLVGAAAAILKNTSAQEDNTLAPPEYFRLMHKAQNLFSPRPADANALFEVDPEDTEALAFWAVMNASEVGALSLEEQLYQRWYIASHLLRDDEHEGLLGVALQAFGDLSTKSHCEQLQAGASVLSEFEACGPSDSSHWKTHCDYH
ncbi:hypothetical protein [Pseudomonas sp. NA-150]|uniref:hypothetical protein n=1 Tax=Pseudomonas sp. NA-150 TaxID=3367525 RepID=UPI0037C6FAE6